MRRVSLQTVVSRRWGDVLWSLRQDPGGLVRAATRSSTGRLYMQVIGFEVSRALRVELGSLRIREGEARTPVYWEAETQPRLFPTMRGELLSLPAAGDKTQLMLTGEYRAPLGLLGRLLDYVIGFWIAQDTLRHFLADVARQLETEQLRSD
jgi:hypothetical protein